MLRRLVFFALVVIMVVGFVACGENETIVGEQIIQSEGYYSFGYITFTGTRNIHFEKQGDIPVNISVLTLGGDVTVEIFQDPVKAEDPSKEASYTGKQMPTGNWDIDLKPDFYILKVTGKAHSGSVGITYF